MTLRVGNPIIVERVTPARVSKSGSARSQKRSSGSICLLVAGAPFAVPVTAYQYPVGQRKLGTRWSNHGSGPGLPPSARTASRSR